MYLFHFHSGKSEINNLDESKAIQTNDIPTKVIKENYDVFATFITENIENSIFLDSRKQVSIKPVSKISRNEKENYRPVSIFPSLFKIYVSVACIHR